jgi:hypothetical protein
VDLLVPRERVLCGVSGSASMAWQQPQTGGLTRAGRATDD